MKKSRRLCRRQLGLLLVVLVFLSACNAADGRVEHPHQDTLSALTAGLTDTTAEVLITQPTTDAKETTAAAQERGNFADALISHWDFQGADEQEQLSDKAGSGAAAEQMVLAPSGASVESGLLKLYDDVAGYAEIASPAGSDLYDLKNKTIVFRARIQNTGTQNVVAGIFSKRGAYGVFFQNPGKDRAVTLTYDQAGSGEKHTTEATTPVGEWRVYAIAVSVTENNQCQIDLYRSINESPEKETDFQLIAHKTVNSIPRDFLCSDDALYLGKRYDHTGQTRGLVSEFSFVSVYQMTLTPAELAMIGGTADAAALRGELGMLIAEAESMQRTLHTDREWHQLQAAIADAKQVNTDRVPELRKCIDKFRQALDKAAVSEVPSQIGDLLQLPYSNPSLTVPIHTGLHAYPGFYDIDGDGKMDYIVSGQSQSYGSHTEGSLFAARFDGEPGTTVFEPTRLLQPSPENPWYSCKTDGSSVFVDRNGVMYTELTNAGYREGISFPELTSHYKLYDIDGDGHSDAVSVRSSTTGENSYTEDGVSAQSRSSSLRWIKNTNTDAEPSFNTEFRTVKNDRGETFTVSDGTGEQYRYIRSFCMLDCDGDGDLDLIAGGWLNRFYYYENIGSRTEPVFCDEGVCIETETGPMALDVCRYNAVNFDWNDDGLDDLIVGSESGTTLYFAFTGRFNIATGAPIFREGEYFSQPAEYIAINVLCRPTSCDLDGDGDFDFIVGDNGGFLWFLENVGTSDAPQWAAPVKLCDENGEVLVIKAGYNGSLQGAQEAEWGYTVPCAADWDGDGDFDLIVNSITGRILLFENRGSPTRPQLSQPRAIEVEWTGENLYPRWQWWTPVGKELVTQHRSTPYAVDLNADGLCDLILLDHEGYLAFFERYRDDGVLKLKPGRRIFVDQAGTPLQLNAKTGGQSGRIKFAVTDWNGDGLLDLIVGEESFALYQAIKTDGEKYNFRKASGNLAVGDISGHNHGFCIVDWNGDGKPDIVSGSESGYLYYFPNNT